MNGLHVYGIGEQQTIFLRKEEKILCTLIDDQCSFLWAVIVDDTFQKKMKAYSKCLEAEGIVGSMQFTIDSPK